MAGVTLSYDAQASGDGLGAQAQRLMGIFGAARRFGVNYVHHPIISIEANPGDPIQEASARERYLNEVNAYFALPSDSPAMPSLCLSFADLTPMKARFIRILHVVTRSFGVDVGIRIRKPFPWCDVNPSSYRDAADLIGPRFEQVMRTEPRRVDVHIRRALAPAVGRDGRPYDRYVSTDWYRAVLLAVISQAQELGVTTSIRVHTDNPRARWQIPSEVTPETRAMWEHHGLVGADGFLVDSQEDLEKSLEGVGPLEVVQEWSGLEVIESMVSADILITYASSLSYVAGLLRRDAPTISPIFFHQCPDDWLSLGHEVGREGKVEIGEWIWTGKVRKTKT